MSAIDVNTIGNGDAYVSNDNPSAGETVTLYCIPFDGETLEDVEAWDDGGYSVALAVQEIQTFTWQYNAMTILATFSSIVPPTPPTPERSKNRRMPIWMYPCLRG